MRYTRLKAAEMRYINMNLKNKKDSKKIITLLYRDCYNMLKSWIQKFISSAWKMTKKLYMIISVISTLTIFSAVLLFAVGQLGLESSCDDDLIMQNIKKQIPDNLEISSITTQDIHGFGNDSLVVLAADANAEDESSANQLLIFDKVDNGVLNQIYNFAGYGSNYKLSYMFSLVSENEEFKPFGYALELLDVVELTGDTSKELVVMFMAIPPGTSGYYQIGIFSYSFEKQAYYLVGTYPPVGGYDLNQDNGIYYWNTPAPTILHSKNASQYNLYNENERFNLEYGTYDDNDFYIEYNGGVLLVRTQMIWGEESHPEPHRHIISVFDPQYNPKKDELEWNVIFSKETTEYTRYCTEEFVIDFLKKNDRYDIVN